MCGFKYWINILNGWNYHMDKIGKAVGWFVTLIVIIKMVVGYLVMK